MTTDASVPVERERRAPSMLRDAWLFALLGAWMLIRPARRWLDLQIAHRAGWWWTDTFTWADNIGTLVFVSVPLVAVATAWRSLGRPQRLVAGVMLAVYAVVAWPLAYGEVRWSVEFAGMQREANAAMAAPRRAMRVPPAVAAAKALAAGDSAFLGVVSYWLEVPLVRNVCLRGRFGVHPIEATGDAPQTPDQARFQRRAGEYAERYNAALAARLRLSRAELQREAPCRFPRHAGGWPPKGR